jgi:hypothetical protein
MSNTIEWQEVGMIGVDAGLCWIGDPCYCVTPDCTEHPAETWSEFCNQLSDDDFHAPKQWNYKAGHTGLGVSVSTGYGDGTYPVFVRRNSEGRITEVKVVFIED